jgi:hypothetical protein
MTVLAVHGLFCRFGGMYTSPALAMSRASRSSKDRREPSVLAGRSAYRSATVHVGGPMSPARSMDADTTRAPRTGGANPRTTRCFRIRGQYDRGRFQDWPGTPPSGKNGIEETSLSERWLVISVWPRACRRTHSSCNLFPANAPHLPRGHATDMGERPVHGRRRKSPATHQCGRRSARPVASSRSAAVSYS